VVAVSFAKKKQHIAASSPGQSVPAGQFFKLEAMMYALDNKTDLNQCFAKRDSGRDESAMEKIFRPSGTEDHGSSRLRRLRKDHCPPRTGNNTDGQHKSDGPPSISGHLSPIQVIYLPTVAKLDSEWRRQISQRAAALKEGAKCKQFPDRPLLSRTRTRTRPLTCSTAAAYVLACVLFCMRRINICSV